MWERIAIYLVAGGTVVVFAAWLWLVIAAFCQRLWWGLAAMVFPLGTLAYAACNLQKAKAPALMLLAGLMLTTVPYGINAYVMRHVDLGAREKIVNGQLHITLTGWDQNDYSLLAARPRTAVLQMANPDVTDQTLQRLANMSQLVELDLNDTAVTDEGLKLLAKLPTLQTLRLRKTAVTDEGIRQLMDRLPQLMELDVRETAVKASTVRRWKNAQQGRRALR